jgi:hypothetical protein
LPTLILLLLVRDVWRRRCPADSHRAFWPRGNSYRNPITFQVEEWAEPLVPPSSFVNFLDGRHCHAPTTFTPPQPPYKISQSCARSLGPQLAAHEKQTRASETSAPPQNKFDQLVHVKRTRALAAQKSQLLLGIHLTARPRHPPSRLHAKPPQLLLQHFGRKRNSESAGTNYRVNFLQTFEKRAVLLGLEK